MGGQRPNCLAEADASLRGWSQPPCGFLPWTSWPPSAQNALSATFSLGQLTRKGENRVTIVFPSCCQCGEEMYSLREQ